MRGISSPILPSSQSGLPLPSGVRWRRTVAALLITLAFLSISFFTFSFYSDINSLVTSRYAYASPTTPESSAAEVVLESNPSATMPEVSLNLVLGGEEGTPEDLDEQENVGQKTCRQASLIRQKYGGPRITLISSRPALFLKFRTAPPPSGRKTQRPVVSSARRFELPCQAGPLEG